MSYSHRTFALFSRAIEDLHGAYEGSVATPSPSWMANVGDSETREDLVSLDRLLENHWRSVAAPARSIASETKTAPDFGRLRQVGLTRRECEVLAWIAEGRRDAEIAAVVGCAPKTVSKHVERLLEKLGAETRLAAAHTAQEWLRYHR